MKAAGAPDSKLGRRARHDAACAMLAVGVDRGLIRATTGYSRQMLGKMWWKVSHPNHPHSAPVLPAEPREPAPAPPTAAGRGDFDRPAAGRRHGVSGARVTP